MLELEERLRRLEDDTLPMPLRPGLGSTPARHGALLAAGREDLSWARLFEAHTDALAILGEADAAPRTRTVYGVWASDGPQSRLQARRVGDQRWQLDGVKQYCSGATLLGAALVTAHTAEGLMLFDVPIDHVRVRAAASTWATPAMADTSTGPVCFEGAIVGDERRLGGPNWYLQRPGFWHGAIGPAACWAGGALSLVDAVQSRPRHDAHGRAHLGALIAAAWAMSAMLDAAGREIDADPEDRREQAHIRALAVRHLIERACSEVLDRLGRATGPVLLASDPQVARQAMALTLYLRQCHAERDQEEIARALEETRAGA
jgi:alkylation response protein AidB-like acyl-CoA dehydrogenase